MDAPYQRLAAQLRQRIVSGEWPLGSRLPSARELRAEYGFGRGVVEYAVATLKREGLIEGKRGARPVVARPAPTVRRLFDPRNDWPYSMAEPSSGTRPASQDLADRLQVPQRTKLTWTRWECLDPDGWAAMLLTTYRRGTKVHSHTETALVAFVDEFTASEAHVIGLTAGTVALRMHRTRYAASGRPVEISDLVLRADRWQVSM
jgi:GntR family transcriptional regulator